MSSKKTASIKGDDTTTVLLEGRQGSSEVGAKIVRTMDGRKVIQMQIDLGLLQMETKGRPDGQTPFGFQTYFAYLKHFAKKREKSLVSARKHACEAIREIKQFNQRCLAWLVLNRHADVLRDADHCLDLLCFLRKTIVYPKRVRDSLERECSMILLRRTQAATLLALEKQGPPQAAEEVRKGIASLRDLPRTPEPANGGGKSQKRDIEKIIRKLTVLEDWIRERYDLPLALEERLAIAIREEEYELAASLRDRISCRNR